MLQFSPPKTHGHLDGEISDQSSADTVNAGKAPKSQPYYAAIIEVSDQGIEDLEANDLTLVAGMPAEAYIKTGERTFFQYLFDPLINVVARSFIED